MVATPYSELGYWECLSKNAIQWLQSWRLQIRADFLRRLFSSELDFLRKEPTFEKRADFSEKSWRLWKEPTFTKKISLLRRHISSELDFLRKEPTFQKKAYFWEKSSCVRKELTFEKRADFWQFLTRRTHAVDSGRRRCIGCLKLQVSFRKRATNFRALLRKMTYKDKASYDVW